MDPSKPQRGIQAKNKNGIFIFRKSFLPKLWLVIELLKLKVSI